MAHFYLTPLAWRTPVNRPPYWAAPDGLRIGLDLRPVPVQGVKGGSPQGMVFCVGEDRLVDESGVIYLGDDPVRSMDVSERDSWRAALGLAAAPSGSTLREVFHQTATVLADPTGDDLAPPLMPDNRGLLRLGLGGFELSRRITPASSEWSGIRDVLRRTYRQTREEGQGNLHRKMLTVWLEKFGLPPEEYKEFIPVDLPDEKPDPHDTVRSDNFNRADQDPLGTSSEGWDWGALVSGFQILNNEAYDETLETEAVVRAEADLSSTDQYVQANVRSSSGIVGLMAVFLRKDSSATLTYYSGFLYEGNNSWHIYKWVSGGATELATGSTTVAGNTFYLLKFQANGSSLSVFKDSSELTTISDSSITTGARCGMDGFVSTTGNLRYDDWEAGDLVGGITFKPWRYRNTPILAMGGITTG